MWLTSVCCVLRAVDKGFCPRNPQRPFLLRLRARLKRGARLKNTIESKDQENIHVCASGLHPIVAEIRDRNIKKSNLFSTLLKRKGYSFVDLLQESMSLEGVLWPEGQASISHKDGRVGSCVSHIDTRSTSLRWGIGKFVSSLRL